MKGSRILLVDDDDELRTLLFEFLNMHGYSVQEFNDPAEALKLLKNRQNSERPLVVTDIRMPKMTGFELLESAKRNGFEGPALVMTARGSADMARLAASNGAHYLEKPFDLNEFGEVIHQLSSRTVRPA